MNALVKAITNCACDSALSTYFVRITISCQYPPHPIPLPPGERGDVILRDAKQQESKKQNKYS